MKKYLTIDDIEMEDFTEYKPIKGRKRISMLIGAGFSAPLGYPIANCLNCKVQKLIRNQGTISFNGGYLNHDNPCSFISDDHQKCFEFLLPLMNEYLRINQTFDYEEFYDYLSSGSYYCEELYKNKLKNKLVQNFPNRETLVDHLLNIYNQIVQSLIKDSQGRQYYGNINNEIAQHYKTFIDYLKKISEEYIIDVHTLNHDLLFEAFNNLENININDGFSEYGSSYFGPLRCNDFEYSCRLQSYSSDNYDQTPINLYKLHGSIGYVPFYRKSNDGCSRKSAYVKLYKGIRSNQVLKEDENNKGKYIESSSERHSDFLTGTSKAKRYNDFFFQELFCAFKSNLRNAEKLIIIGYGGKDKEINTYIVRNFDYKHKPIYIVNPSPCDKLNTFKNRFNAKIIKKSITDIDVSDFD